jgi:hypothetical protein
VRSARRLRGLDELGQAGVQRRLDVLPVEVRVDDFVVPETRSMRPAAGEDKTVELRLRGKKVLTQQQLVEVLPQPRPRVLPAQMK